ncbi:MAG: hypothetical protein ACRBC3_08880 [Burkholderiaceae bacterium]
MKNTVVSTQANTAPSDVLDWVDSPNVYAAARAERTRYVRGLIGRLFSSQKAAKAAPNADGLAPLGMTA